MNKKFMGLAFVVIVAGCQPPQQGAVCPASEEEEVAEPEPTSGAEVQPLSKEDIEKARQYIRATRNK